MSAALVAGLAAGDGVAIPVGAIAPLLMNLSARSGQRVGAAAGVGGPAPTGSTRPSPSPGERRWPTPSAPVAEPLRWAAATALALSATRLAAVAWRDHRAAGRPPATAEEREPHADRGAAGRAALLARPGRAYGALLGLTILNPATLVYFTATVSAGVIAALAARLVVSG